jgi:tetratricopeptide (TPR) repeat protein
LGILENSLGKGHPEVAYGLSHLANLLFLQARYTEAEAMQRRAIAILQRTPGQKVSTLATTLNDLADMTALRGRYSEADSLYQQAQTAWERLLGTEHPNVA